MKKNGARGKSLSALAAGLSAGGRPKAALVPPRDPQVAALARKGAGSSPVDVARSQRLTAKLMAKRASSPSLTRPAESRAPPAVVRPASARPAIAHRPPSGSTPQSRPGPSSGIAAGLKGTTRLAQAIAPLVKVATNSRAAPASSASGMSGAKLADHRRKYPRAELAVKARLALSDDPRRFFEAALPTANVSVGGLFLASTFFLKLGTRLEVRLSLPPHGREVHVKGQVVRVESNDSEHTGFALRFTDYLDGSEVVLATHFLSPVLREFIQEYARGNGFQATPEYLAHTADVLAAWELRRAELGGDVWVVPGDR